MPVHDWTRVDAGLFHAFHQGWIVSLCNALNAQGLPPDFYALAEPSMPGAIPDALTLQLAPGAGPPAGPSPAVAVADRVTVRHRHGQVVAVIEIVSPGNKGSNSELRAFVATTADLIQQGFTCS